MSSCLNLKLNTHHFSHQVKLGHALDQSHNFPIAGTWENAPKHWIENDWKESSCSYRQMKTIFYKSPVQVGKVTITFTTNVPTLSVDIIKYKFTSVGIKYHIYMTNIYNRGNAILSQVQWRNVPSQISVDRSVQSRPGPVLVGFYVG